MNETLWPPGRPTLQDDAAIALLIAHARAERWSINRLLEEGERVLPRSALNRFNAAIIEAIADELRRRRGCDCDYGERQ